MNSHLSLRLTSLLLDAVSLVAFLIIALLSVPIPSLRHTALHALTRNFWGTATPRLDGRPVVWVHTNSVGEVLVCQALLARLRCARPDLQFVISIGTSDGMDVALQQFPDLEIFPTPFDFSWAVRRTFDAIQPIALLISENDFWPQMLFEALRRDIPLAIFNTRIGPRELTEHRWNAWLLKPGLCRARWWGAVTQQDADGICRFFSVQPPQLQVTGSLKWDGGMRDRNQPQTVELRRQFGFTANQQILVAGSTHSPEEAQLIALAARIAADDPLFRLVIVPRSAARGPSISRICDENNVPCVLASQVSASLTASPLVTIIDRIGNLRAAWGLANFAFVGGSIAKCGGQNMIEPASYGLPICFGPHVWDFQSVTDELLRTKAAVQVQNVNELEIVICGWRDDPPAAQRIGRAAQELVRTRTAPLELTVRGILSVLPDDRANQLNTQTADQPRPSRPIAGVS